MQTPSPATAASIDLLTLWLRFWHQQRRQGASLSSLSYIDSLVIQQGWRVIREGGR